jgi:DegV family protein with EDD domain
LPPGTSQPPPAHFEEVFRALAVDHDAIVVVLLSAKLSGTLNSAAVAAAAVAPLVPIELVDSRTGSMALGFQALPAAELAAAGIDASVIAEGLRAEVQRHHVVFFVDTLEYLQRGGRIGRAAALISGMLQLKPLLRIDEGQVVPWERTRTRSRALAGQIDVARGLPAIERVAALYSSDRTEGIAFADRIASELSLPREQVVVAQIGPTVATRIGPGAMGIAVVEAVP